MSSELSTQLLHEFPELAHLSREDLEDLLSDQSYFQAAFHSLPRVKAMYQAQSELGMANEAIAKNNLALQDSLYHLRAETKDAFDEAKALEARWKELEKEQRDVYQRFTPQFLLMRLRHATIAQDEASEALATAGRDIDDFVKEFKDLRKVYHKRVIWGDRWNSGQVAWRDD
ncbi:hypothetical protein BDZ89DRAFT_1088926 [Hymenopellis radicata]|nr:hypothetical protein BDZ89DRAFT_1088926 [Hymenopellis radicata]